MFLDAIVKSPKAKAWLAIVCAVIVSSSSTMLYRCITLFYDTILETTGCTAGQYGLIFTVIAIGLVLGGMVTGKMLEWNQRVTMGLCSIATAVLYVAISMAPSITIFYVAAFIFGFLYNQIGMTMWSIVAARWFNRGVGKIMSIGVIAMFGSQAIFVPVGANMVVAWGGPEVALGIGLVVAVICFVISVFVMPLFPEYYGMQPVDLGKPDPKEEAKKAAEQVDDGMVIPALRAAKTPTFIMLFLGFFFLCCGYSNFTANSITIFQSFGVDYVSASIGVSVSSIAAMILAFVQGAAIDKIGPRPVIIFFTLVAAVTCFTTGFMEGMVGVIIFGILVNFAGVYEVIAGTVCPKLFGIKASAQLIAWLMMAGNLAISIFPAIGASIYGSTGSYVITYAVAGVVLFAAAAMYWIGLSEKSYAKMRELNEEYKRELAAKGE